MFAITNALHSSLHVVVVSQWPSLRVLWSHLQLQQLVSPLHQHGDVVAAADRLVDLLRGVDLHAVDLHHHVSRVHASSEARSDISLTGLWSSLPSVRWDDPFYLLAGEPAITLWIRMPCVTSGKEGSLSFNSAMMLQQRDEEVWSLVLAVEGWM